jgi:L-asparaginase II
MANPVLCEATRGGLVESWHRGAVAVFDADGKSVLELGDTERPLFPRSAVKAIQALVLVESGAADAYGFGNRELALACASHSGSEIHASLAAAMLRRAGLGEEALECGIHWPNDPKAAARLSAEGRKPGPLHNNCSGKHAGFLCACVHLGFATSGYVGRDHPIQKQVREALQSVTGAAHSLDRCGIDGCSIPTYAIPLSNLARGFARMATGAGLSPSRARAARQLFAACIAEPAMVDGEGRSCTRLIEAGAGRVFAKNGAEGVYCGAIPELGLGIAVKCDDGAGRAAVTIFAATVARLLAGDEISQRFHSLARPDIPTRKGAAAGVLRPAGALEHFL